MSYNSITNSYTNPDNIIAKSDRFVSETRGDALEPAFSIVENVGMYSSDIDYLSFAVDGVTPLELTKTQIVSTKPIRNQDGSSINPAYSFSSDPDSGMYLESKGVVAVDATDFKVSGTINSNLTVGSNLTSTVPFLAPNGSKTTPAYSFSSDTDSGIYRESDGKFSISCNDTRVMRFSPTLVEFFVGTSLSGLFNTGSASVPSISFTIDPDTGFYSNGGGTMTFTADGTPTVRFDSIQSLAIKDGSYGYPSLTFLNNSSIGLYRSGSYLGISEYGSRVAEFSHTDIKAYSQIQSSDGTATAPAYSFASDAKSGMYHGTGSVGISYLSNDIFRVNANGTSTTGTSLADSFYFRNDTNTGISNTGIDDLNLITGGSARLQISNTELISYNPYRGDVGSVSAPGLSFRNYTNTGFYYDISGLALNTSLAGTKRMTIDGTSCNIYTSAGAGFITFASPVLGNTGLFRGADVSNVNYPTYSFNSDTSTGMYLDGSGHLAFATSAVKTMDITTSAVKLIATPVKDIAYTAYGMDAVSSLGTSRSFSSQTYDLSTIPREYYIHTCYTTTSWSVGSGASSLLGSPMMIYTSSPNSTNYLRLYPTFVFAKAIYQIQYNVLYNDNTAIIDFGIDVANSGTFTKQRTIDTWSGRATTANLSVTYRDYFVVSASSIQPAFEWKVNGKNASSTNYYVCAGNVIITKLYDAV